MCIFFLSQLTQSLQDGPSAPQYFRLNQLEEECEFVSQKEFAKSKRFKLIQLRDKGVRRHANSYRRDFSVWKSSYLKEDVTQTIVANDLLCITFV